MAILKYYIPGRYSGQTSDYYHRIQKGKCAACGKGSRRTLNLDHDHKTGIIRGLLCHNCNIALGMVHDNVSTLLKLAFYLKKHENA